MLERDIMQRLTREICDMAAMDLNGRGLLPPGFRYRAGTVRDLDAIMNIGLACFDSDEPERHKVRHFLSDAHAVIGVLCEGERIIGYAHLEAHMGRKNIYLNTTALLPAYRGRGLGDTLYILTEDIARAVKASSIWCHVHIKDPLAIHLLKKHGYVIERTEDPYYDDGQGAYVMRKSMQ